MALSERRLAFIGGGHITHVIIDNLVKANNVYAHRLIVSDPDKRKLERLYESYEIAIADDNLDAVDKGDFVFINVLPQIVTDVIAELRRGKYIKNKVIVTLAAGIPMGAYESLGEKIPVVRALPNPPSQIGMGIAALTFNPYVSETQKKDILELFALLGEYIILREENMNAVMALSSPATIYLFFQSLIDAGIRVGIDGETATKIVYKTIVGAMEIWKQRKKPPHELLNEASTPGGISVEAVFTLEKYAFRAALKEAIFNAVARAAEFSQAFQKKWVANGSVFWKKEGYQRSDES